MLLTGWTLLILAYGMCWGYSIGYDKGLRRAYGVDKEDDND